MNKLKEQINGRGVNPKYSLPSSKILKMQKPDWDNKCLFFCKIFNGTIDLKMT